MKRELIIINRDLRVTHKPISENVCVLLPQGVIDSSTSEEFKNRVRTFLEDGRASSNVLLDVSGVKYISSNGLGALIQLFKASEKNNTVFALYDPPLPVRRVLEISKLDFLLVKPEDARRSGPFADYIGQKESSRPTPK